MININIQAWIAGAVIVFTSGFGFILGERVFSPFLDFAHTQTISASAWDAINLTLSIWRPSMLIMGIAGLIYIVYSSIPVERESNYGGY